MVHSQVLHHLPVVIPGVRKEDTRGVESRSPELLNIPISYRLEQILVGQRAQRSVCMSERIFQIADNIILAGKIPRPFLTGGSIGSPSRATAASLRQNAMWHACTPKVLTV